MAPEPCQLALASSSRGWVPEQRRQNSPPRRGRLGSVGSLFRTSDAVKRDMIYDGRGIAAAFMLGAVGVNIGTHFLASQESPSEFAALAIGCAPRAVIPFNAVWAPGQERLRPRQPLDPVPSVLQCHEAVSSGVCRA